MKASATTVTWTTEEIFALPNDRLERDLIRGELRVYPSTFRVWRNAQVLMAVGVILGNWVDTHQAGAGEVAAANVGVRLKRHPETMVGLDADYFSAASIAQMPPKQPWYEGPPVLAVEILSPSDTHEGVVEKINLYLECGVPVVWIVDPDFQTLMVYRPDQAPAMLSVQETLDGHPELPGLKVAVREFFN